MRLVDILTKLFFENYYTYHKSCRNGKVTRMKRDRMFEVNLNFDVVSRMGLSLSEINQLDMIPNLRTEYATYCTEAIVFYVTQNLVPLLAQWMCADQTMFFMGLLPESDGIKYGMKVVRMEESPMIES